MAGMVTAMDDAVGHIVAALKDTGHYDNSVIVFTTDVSCATRRLKYCAANTEFFV